MDAVRYAPLGSRGGAGGTRAARFGTVSWEEHTRTSNEQIVLSVMTEDEKGISQIGDIARLPGIDIVSIGPTDFSEYMGIRDPQSPVIRARLEELAAEVKAAGGAKLSIPMNHPAFPLTAGELQAMGVGVHARGAAAAGAAAAVAARAHRRHSRSAGLIGQRWAMGCPLRWRLMALVVVGAALSWMVACQPAPTADVAPTLMPTPTVTATAAPVIMDTATPMATATQVPRATATRIATLIPATSIPATATLMPTLTMTPTPAVAPTEAISGPIVRIGRTAYRVELALTRAERAQGCRGGWRWSRMRRCCLSMMMMGRRLSGCRICGFRWIWFDKVGLHGAWGYGGRSESAGGCSAGGFAPVYVHRTRPVCAGN